MASVRPTTMPGILRDLLGALARVRDRSTSGTKSSSGSCALVAAGRASRRRRAPAGAAPVRRAARGGLVAAASRPAGARAAAPASARAHLARRPRAASAGAASRCPPSRVAAGRAGLELVAQRVEGALGGGFGGARRPRRRPGRGCPATTCLGRSSTFGMSSGSTPLSSTPVAVRSPWVTIIGLMTNGADADDAAGRPRPSS